MKWKNMPKNDSIFPGWTRASYREFMANNHATAMQKNWDAGILRQMNGQCMTCGCPKDDYHMKISPSPYNCSVCEKKTLGEEEYNKRMEQIAFIQDEIHPQGSRAIFAFVKRTILHGFNTDPLSLDKVMKGESDGTEGRPTPSED
jgi:hypothetical protein